MKERQMEEKMRRDVLIDNMFLVNYFKGVYLHVESGLTVTVKGFFLTMGIISIMLLVILRI